MHTTDSSHWEHSHSFGQDRQSRGERPTRLVVLLTASFMVVEIAAGIAYGSMALLADGLHMGSHAVALGIAVAAYVYARRHAGDERFSFGTGKVNALGGFTGALLLAVFAVLMARESIDRFVNPVAIVFNQAIAVAVVGLLVNGVSVAILGLHSHGHDHGHGHGLGHDDHEHHDHDHDHHDHNLRAAYLHVLADAVTSLTAIAALLAGKFFGLNWMDPAMGLVGTVLVGSWSWGLLRQTSRVLLDHQEPKALRQKVKDALEADTDDRVTDLHVWSIGPGARAAVVALVSHDPQTPEHYKGLVPHELKIQHVTVEVHHCSGQLETPHRDSQIAC